MRKGATRGGSRYTIACGARVALHKWVRHHVTPIRPWAINVVKWGEEKVASDVTDSLKGTFLSCTECGVRWNEEKRG